MSNNQLNEETVKNRYLIPYLQRLGFDVSELSFEDQFTIRIGRSKLRHSAASGRLDILVKRHGRNLFLIEAKREGKSLNQSDRDQAISYARLVDPVAPYVLLTNGNEFRRYETLTKKDVSEGEISPDSDFELSLPPSLIEEASRHFLGLSEANLATFCRLQVEEEARPLIGSKEEPGKKYIPELFEQRTAFNTAINQFLAESRVLFAFIADSGAGKTCCVCDLVLQRVEHQPVLFYRGINLAGSLLEAIASDFGWAFSENLTSVTLIRRLEALVSSQPLLIVVDGIDEWEHTSRRQDLLATARRLATVKGVRLIVSCKATVWHQFTTARGQPTGLERYLFVGLDKEGGGFALQPMSNLEFSRVLDRYRKFYNVGRGWEDAALQEARRNPFFMRVAFEVAAEIGGEHVVLDSARFFSQYFDQALARLDRAEAAKLLLVSIVRELLREGEERLPLQGLAQSVGPAYSNELLEELIEYQILERSATDGSARISFYFSLLRDYIVAFHCERWHEVDDAEFRKVVDTLGDSATELEALMFFYRHASPPRKRMIDSDARARAEKILRTYQDLLASDFKVVRHRFVPYTRKRIGYVGTFMPGTPRLGFCNFRELRDSDEEVLLVPATGQRLYDSNLPHLYRAQGLVGVTAIQEDSNVIDWTLNMAIGRQLRGIIEQGKLMESHDPLMVSESLAAVVSMSSCGYAGEPHPARLRKRPPKYPRQIPNLFPLELSAVRKWLKYWLLHSHFKERMARQTLASGEIPIEETENGYIYSPDLGLEDMQEMQELIESEIDRPLAEVRQLVGHIREERLRNVYERVVDSLDSLESRGIQLLEDELFPEHEILDRSGLRPEPVCRYLERVYSLALEAFSNLVKVNFPTLFSEFPSIRWQPLTIILAVRLNPRERHYNRATIYICRGNTSNRIIALPEDQAKVSMQQEPHWSFGIEVDGEKFVRRESTSDTELLGQKSMYLSRVLNPGGTYLGSKTSLSSVGARIPAILRTIVYDWLREELAVVFAKLCSKHEVEYAAQEWRSFDNLR